MPNQTNFIRNSDIPKKNRQTGILDFILRTYSLKYIPRVGWSMRGILQSGEDTVAGHTTLTCLVSLILGLQAKMQHPKLDLERILGMALLHDLSEVVTGDIDKPVLDQISKRDPKARHILESNALNQLIGELPKPITDFIKQRVAEHNAKDTLEAKIVNEADRIEVALQSLAFINAGYNPSLFQRFFAVLEDIRKKSELNSTRVLIKEILERYNRIRH